MWVRNGNAQTTDIWNLPAEVSETVTLLHYIYIFVSSNPKHRVDNLTVSWGDNCLNILKCEWRKVILIPPKFETSHMKTIGQMYQAMMLGYSRL